LQVRTNWKLKLLAGALSLGAFAAFTVPASAQISVIIGRTPPPLRFERRPPPPGEGYAWIDGYWGANGAYWSHPHYDHYQDGWHLHEGHWDHEDHGDHYYEGRR